MDDPSLAFNYVEAVLWPVVGFILFVKSFHPKPRVCKTLRGLAITFVVFGVSDLIEARTGAWWDPWWLLAMKSVCGAVFILGFRAYFKAMRVP